MGAKQPRSINPKFLVGGALLLVLACLIVWATMTAGAYYLTVNEIVSKGDTIVGERVRMNGLVVADSDTWDEDNHVLRFAVYDENDKAGAGDQIQVVFYGPKPDNFHRAASAIIEGEVIDENSQLVFKADTLLLKCPSRYEEEPSEIFVKSER
ncbi:MAG: cytochrome c maturation protein CcmE [Caldilineaceae bacterium]